MKVVVLTGAGISAESGLPTFRDADGLWEGYDPMVVATPEAFEDDPDLVGGHEPIALRNSERRATATEFTKGQRLVELSDPSDADSDRHASLATACHACRRLDTPPGSSGRHCR